MWRTLSRANRKVADGAAKLPLFADDLAVRFDRPAIAFKKLDLFIDTLEVQVAKLTIRNLASINIVMEINQLGERLSRCSQLKHIDFEQCVYLAMFFSIFSNFKIIFGPNCSFKS